MHIDDVRGGTKVSGAYLKVFQRPFMKSANT